MRWVKPFTGFQFDEDNTSNYQIRVVGSYRLPMEPDWNRNLSLEIDTTLFECHRHRFFINFFKKPETELIINIVENADDLLGQF